MWLFVFGSFLALPTISFPDQPDIRLKVAMSPGYQGPVCFFAPHENEHVANRYLAKKVQREGGKFIILSQSGERHLTLKLAGVDVEAEVEVDPNRIFTLAGARATLLSLNPELAENSPLFAAALARAIAVGQFVLAQMDQSSAAVWVAVHNNTNGYDGDGKGGEGTISMARYRQKLQTGAKYIKALNRGCRDEDDLFFITAEEDFHRLAEAGWNVVLQHPQVAELPSEDDGSLSVLAEKKGLRYLNIEAQRKPNHLRVQKKMINAVYRLVFN